MTVESSKSSSCFLEPEKCKKICIIIQMQHELAYLRLPVVSPGVGCLASSSSTSRLLLENALAES